MMCLFAVIAVGYLLGRISIKGISLGTAGVFIVALIFGCVFYKDLSNALTVDGKTFVSQALKIVENIGLMFFVTAVGFIAGPGFVANFKKNFKSYVLLGLVIIVSGALACVGCIFIGRNFTKLNHAELTAMMVGLFSGALTSTPAFSAAKDAVAEGLDSIVSTGYGIAYLFGVVGVVLFVQLIPKIMKADVAEERKKITATDTGKKKVYNGKLVDMDEFGLMPLGLAILLGIVIGSLKFGSFSLTTTGGCLLAGLVFGHFGHIGAVNLMPKNTTLKVLRELGLVFFLMGAGISGGSRFIELFEPVYFLYGVVITLVPMIIGFVIAKFVLKLPLFNNLGSITGGMTSTPALGTLISVTGTEDVASAYAATYPIALISVVFAAQLIIIFLS
ncbi:MAG: permease [Oscillospiraceae bacterium]|nr:permease [Oscillospiraceae bacterium]